MRGNHRNSHGNVVIGVFTAELNDSYQAQVWEGIISAARKNGIGLICFLGSRVNSPIPQEASSNVIYRMACKDNIDGLIVISSAISTYLDYEEVCALFTSHNDIPRVSIGLEIPGVPSITVDGKKAMKSTVEHLVTHHERKKFALITGPQGHEESETRKKVFLETLKAHRIVFNEAMEFCGTFEKESGILAVTCLLEQALPFDALVCLNDKMALGALQELKKRGIRIPEDVSLVGFDGLEEAECGLLSLTTVRQPLSELGETAIEEICSLVTTGKASSRILQCTRIPGESCGCRPRQFLNREQLLEFESQLSKNERISVEQFSRDLATLNEDDFLLRLRRSINALRKDSRQLSRLHSVLCLLQNRILDSHCGFCDPGMNAKAEILMQAFTLLAESERREQASLRLSMKDRFSTARAVGVSLAEAFEVPAILDNLAEGLVRLGFTTSYLVLQNPVSQEQEKSHMYILPDTTTSADNRTHKGIEFTSLSILPEQTGNEWKKNSWVLVPLVFQAELLGYLLLPAQETDSAIYDVLSKQIASTLKGTRLLDQVRLHERNLEHEVRKRTAELTEANTRLTREISRRIRLEQEVVEISNRTMTRIGQDLHDDLCQHLAGISMIVTALRKTLPVECREGQTIDQINRLIVDSIERTKVIVRGLVPPDIEEQGLALAVDAFIEATARSHGKEISYSADRNFDFQDPERSFQIYRIIQEAVTNSIKHGKGSLIMVRLRTTIQKKRDRSEKVYIIEIIDNGTGIPEKMGDKGMGLKIMKYRAEKAGAELDIESPGEKGGTTVRCTLI